MLQALERAQLDLQGIEVDLKKAKLDLTGEALAKRLAELDRQRREVQARVPDLETGLKLYRDDVEAARQKAQKALNALADQAAYEIFQEAKAEYQAALDKLAETLGQQAPNLYLLRHAARPPHPGEHAHLIGPALEGKVPGEGTAEPAPLPETPPAAEDEGEDDFSAFCRADFEAAPATEAGDEQEPAPKAEAKAPRRAAAVNGAEA